MENTNNNGISRNRSILSKCGSSIDNFYEACQQNDSVDDNFTFESSIQLLPLTGHLKIWTQFFNLTSCVDKVNDMVQTLDNLATAKELLVGSKKLKFTNLILIFRYAISNNELIIPEPLYKAISLTCSLLFPLSAVPN